MRIKALMAAPLLALILTAAPARAEPAEAALRLYAAGDFLAAADLADDRETAASLSFASRALMAQCATAPSRSDLDTWLARAERAARDALELDPQSVDARLQLALVYGARGRRASLTQAFAGRYAPRGRALIDEALALEPRNARAHALLGAWNLEVLRRGGRFGAVTYGASYRAGAAEFERAMALAPDDPTIPLHYAFALLELNAAQNADRAAALLRRAAGLRPRDALERFVTRTAQRIARTLEEDGPGAAQRAARATFL
ncbi:hypothetical protein [Terricaulis sp.]|uniref:hypothetical protein n=1 Tax=Terricaulis sp. TaxID=2768686 RepID=UPI0037850C78